MSMSPSHFVPHQADLNSLGVSRLSRMAELLNVYGGTIHYDGARADVLLDEVRLETIREFLLACGVPGDRFETEASLARGQGIPSTLALRIREATDPIDGEKRLQRGGAGGASGGGGGGQN
jgi:hypothetical protein